MPDMNTFEFLITEEDDVALLLYAREGKADRALVRLFRNEQKVEFYRNEEDELTLENVEDNVFVSLAGKKQKIHLHQKRRSRHRSGIGQGDR